jgi:hypothetical protein
MPIFTLTLAANVRCYRSDHQVEAENLDDLIAKMRAEASVGLHAALKPDWETMSGETALDISDASGATVAEDVMLGYVPPHSDSDLMDAAMCLWEAVLEHEDIWQASRDALGIDEVRRFAAHIARTCLNGWGIAHADGDGFDDPFDWEFCPWFVRNCVADDDRGGLSIDTLWRRKCEALRDRSIADKASYAAEAAANVAARAAITAPDAESLPDAAWMLVVDLHGSQCGGTVWAFDDNAHQSAMDICNARGLRFGTLKVFGSKAVAALLELSEGMNDADELAFAQGGLDQ